MGRTFFTSAGTEIAYEICGEGYPLLFLHGFPRTRRTWDILRPLLSQRFTMITPDRRGYGDSQASSDHESYRLQQLTADASGLLGAIGISECLVVGHNRGAPVARNLAFTEPHLVRGAFIMDSVPDGFATPGRKDPTGRTWYFDFYRQRGVAEAIMKANPQLFFSLFLDRNPHLSQEEHQLYVEAFSNPDSIDAVLADYRHGLEDDPAYWEEHISDGRLIDVPVYIVWGAQGPSANVQLLEAWRKAAHDVDGEQIANAGHYIHEMNPEATAKAINRFADRLNIAP